jgi:hypothetical protein
LEEENESLKKIQNKLKCVQCAGWKKIVPWIPKRYNGLYP